MRIAIVLLVKTAEGKELAIFIAVTYQEAGDQGH